MYVCVIVHVCVWIEANDVPPGCQWGDQTRKLGWDSLFTENSFPEGMKPIS